VAGYICEERRNTCGAVWSVLSTILPGARVLKKVFKIVGWLCVGVVGLIVLLYAGLLFINRHDSPPSEAILRMEALSKPKVPDAQNGYFILLGLDAPPGEDAQAYGLKRWNKNVEASKKNMSDALKADTEERDRVRKAHWGNMPIDLGPKDQCPTRLEKCFDPDVQVDAIRKMVRPYEPRLARLQSYTGAAQCEEPTNILFVGEFAVPELKVMLLSASLSRQSGDIAKAKAELRSAMAFVLKQSNCGRTLVSSMIGVAQASSLIEFVNAWLDRFPGDAMLIQSEISPRLVEIENELREALVRSCEGEFAISKSVYDATSRGFTLFETSADFSPYDRVQNTITKPLWLSQDTQNELASQVERRRKMFSTPGHSLDEAILDETAFSNAQGERAFSITSLYGRNPVGKIVSALSAGAYNDYPKRNYDGIARLRLLRVKIEALALAGEGKKVDNPATVLGERGFNPHTNAPFDWNAETKTLSFTPKHPRTDGPTKLSAVKIDTAGLR
jgi:hypothetical protein